MKTPAFSQSQIRAFIASENQKQVDIDRDAHKLDIDINIRSLSQLYGSLFHICILLLLQTVLNSEKFGPLTNSSTVIAVQVHNRITYLR